MYVDSCLFWEGTVLLSNSLIPQIREILDFRARSADASLEHISSFQQSAHDMFAYIARGAGDGDPHAFWAARSGAAD